MAWVKEEDKPVILFRRCLGLNDDRAFATQTLDVDSGSTEFTDCLNFTVTSEGAVEKIAPFVTALTHSAPITNISAGSRFIYQDGIDTKEWNGTGVATIGAIMDGPIVHTPLDVRVAGTGKVYKSSVPAYPLLEATVGDLSNFPDRAIKPYAAQPEFTQAFVYNGYLYGINAADTRFLQYSAYTHFDAWRLGDDHIGHTVPVLQAGAIPGAMICTHATGVTVYTGTDMSNFAKKFYACRVIDGTLFSGYIGKTYSSGQGNRTYGYCHVFLCADGVYIVTPEGELVNLTAATTSYLDTLNSSYSCVTLHGPKYLAFGNNVCIEYDFETGAVLKRQSGVTAATVWNSVNYYATGSTVSTMGTDIDTTADFTASLTLPYSKMGRDGTKSLFSLYFTGTITGDVTFTATDQSGKSWEIEVCDLGTVSNYRIKTPKGILGNHISLKIVCTSGAFRMEELRASLSASQRTR